MARGWRSSRAVVALGIEQSASSHAIGGAALWRQDPGGDRGSHCRWSEGRLLYRPGLPQLLRRCPGSDHRFGGRITDVKALQYPTDRPQSAYISSVAIPYLHDEVLKAQSAQIDIITGATFTSDSYAQSLQSALARA